MKPLQDALNSLEAAVQLVKLNSKNPDVKKAIQALIKETQTALLKLPKSITGGGDEKNAAGS